MVSNLVTPALCFLVSSRLCRGRWTVPWSHPHNIDSSTILQLGGSRLSTSVVHASFCWEISHAKNDLVGANNSFSAACDFLIVAGNYLDYNHRRSHFVPFASGPLRSQGIGASASSYRSRHVHQLDCRSRCQACAHMKAGAVESKRIST